MNTEESVKRKRHDRDALRRALVSDTCPACEPAFPRPRAPEGRLRKLVRELTRRILRGWVLALGGER